ncbi:unnamed protein product [Acanthoscelides obtectus]|uniref:Uncharacterized protein n=1 Tax=Acanthoscelides obtectus TaxID=200917 RepID=A0A9P0PCM3_ACAOB|nr:unnamed protein product [Acanthoscelides obtectus]CAK1627844.1 Slit homolog 1 protein [Acanthoscelides obtectus]
MKLQKMLGMWCILPNLIMSLVGYEIADKCPVMCQCDSVITNCRGNELSRLPPEINPEVVSLDLSFNEFQRFPTELTMYRELKYLNMSHNRISTLSHSVFYGMSQLERFDLSHNYFCDWKDLHTQAFTHLTSLGYLDLSHNALRSIPQFSKHFENSTLEILKLNNCSMISVPVQIFDHLPRLKELHLKSNPIRILSGTLFVSDSIKFIDFSGCSLEFLLPKLFTRIDSLETLVLSNNTLLRKLECNSDSLLYLDLSNSNLETVPTGSMRKLAILNLRGNSLKALLNNSFVGCPNLVRLNLSLNSISAVEENAFKGLDYLEFLDLSSNKLTVLNEKVFLPVISLVDLSLSHNYINTLDTITSSSLKYLDVSYCEIYTVSRYSLTNLPKLSRLSLARNFISYLPDSWTGDRVTELDVSGCRIKSINNMTFKQMYYLKKLDLSSNRLSHVEPDFFPQNLQLVKLDDNQWRCDCPKLKAMYEELYMNGGRTESLICDSPEEATGLTWRDACAKEWFPDATKKKQLWWYSVAVVISMTCFLIVIIALRKLTSMKEKRLREAEEQRRGVEREAREALQRMQRLHREYREEEDRNAPDPRELQSPPSYTDALLLPRLDSSQGSLAGSMHSVASMGSQGSTAGSKKGRIRRKRRRRRSETESKRQSRATIDDTDSSDVEQQRLPRLPLESDF